MCRILPEQKVIMFSYEPSLILFEGVQTSTKDNKDRERKKLVHKCANKQEIEKTENRDFDPPPLL